MRAEKLPSAEQARQGNGTERRVAPFALSDIQGNINSRTVHTSQPTIPLLRIIVLGSNHPRISGVLRKWRVLLVHLQVPLYYHLAKAWSWRIPELTSFVGFGPIRAGWKLNCHHTDHNQLDLRMKMITFQMHRRAVRPPRDRLHPFPQQELKR